MNSIYSIIVLITSAYDVLCRPKHGYTATTWEKRWRSQINQKIYRSAGLKCHPRYNISMTKCYKCLKELDEDMLRINQYYCHKLKACKNNDKPVCGFDEEIPHLAVFADLCTLYKANCRKVGYYHLVDMVVCETRSSYDKEHVNETFEYIHIITTLPTDTETKLTNFDSVIGNFAGVDRFAYQGEINLEEVRHQAAVKVRTEKFAEFNCYKLKSCVPIEKPVCGFHPKTHAMAAFPNLCTLYGVNCYRQGLYQLISYEYCKPDVVFLERVTNKYGIPEDLYETVPPFTTLTTTVATTRTFLSFWTLTTRWTIPPEFTTTEKAIRKGFSHYSVLDFISGLLDYLKRVL